jgi:hypothetical protein
MRKSAPEFDDPRAYSPGYYPRLPIVRSNTTSPPSFAPGPVAAQSSSPRVQRRRGRPAFREAVRCSIGVSDEVHARLTSMKSRDSEALEDVLRRLLIMPPRTLL